MITDLHQEIPTFSLIIPVFNKEKYIINVIDSILQQIVLPSEIIIIDDCSTDNGMKIARDYAAKSEHFSRFIFSENTINSGPGITRNKGISLASSEYILFMDADDELEKDHIFNFSECIMHYGSNMLISRVRIPASGRIQPSESVLKRCKRMAENTVMISCPLELMKTDILFISANYCFNRKYFEGIVFSQEYHFEDWCFTYRLLRKMKLNNEPLWILEKPSYIYTDDNPLSLSLTSIKNVDRFSIPLVCIELKNDKEIEILNKMFSIWFFDSLRRIETPILKLKFINKFRKDILANFNTSKFFLAGFLILLLNRKLTERLISMLR